MSHQKLYQTISCLFYTQDWLSIFLGRKPKAMNDLNRQKASIYDLCKSLIISKKKKKKKAELAHQVECLVQQAKNTGFTHAEVLKDMRSEL